MPHAQANTHHCLQPVFYHERFMLYLSTRRHSPAVNLSQAIAAGLAPDGGLYVPESLPSLTPDAFDPYGNLVDTTHTLLAPFFVDDPLAEVLPRICREALDFDIPLRSLPHHAAYMLELFHGPTAAFKDVGARFLAACLRRLNQPGQQTRTIVVATSGDTGAAVGAAFHRQTGIRVVILYPDNLVSPRQAHQLGCFGDNVQTLRVQGCFDDCQRMVKGVLHDNRLRTEYTLSSANSISLGRLLPQMSYYAHVALRWWHAHQLPFNFIIPTGNLGNALAALWVRKIGLPVGKIYLACNANNTLPEFFAGGDYRPRDAIATLANAMDVGAPSNFERLRWTFPDLTETRTQSRVLGVDDATIRQTLARHASQHNEVFCPHTATAMHFLDYLREAGDMTPWTVVATAHPAKFNNVVEPATGRLIPAPPALEAMLQRSASAQPLAATEAALKQWLSESVK